jgi:hypothetical protein
MEWELQYDPQMVKRLCINVSALGEKDILQSVTEWMAKNTVPVTIWGVPVWNGGGRRKISHVGTPRNHKVFVTIWGLTAANPLCVSRDACESGWGSGITYPRVTHDQPFCAIGLQISCL